MDDKTDTQAKPELSIHERWRNLCNVLSEEALAENDVTYPQAESVRLSLLKRLAQDAKAKLIPPEISDLLEQAPPATSAAQENSSDMKNPNKDQSRNPDD
jgi:hypothetical protein